MHFVTHGSASVILGFDRKQKQVDSFKNSSHIQWTDNLKAPQGADVKM